MKDGRHRLPGPPGSARAVLRAALLLAIWCFGCWVVSPVVAGTRQAFCAELNRDYRKQVFLARVPLYDTEIGEHGIWDLERDNEEIPPGVEFRVQDVECNGKRARFELSSRGRGGDEIEITFFFPPTMAFAEDGRERFHRMTRHVFAEVGESLVPPLHAAASPPTPAPARSSTPPPRTAAGRPASFNDVADLEPPFLQVPESLTTEQAEVAFVGRALDHSPMRGIRVDGQLVVPDRDGVFQHSRYVPIGTVRIPVEATDQWGNRTRATVSITRRPVAAVNLLPPPNPLAVRGLEQKDAIAIVIGVDEYQYAARAEYAENDARMFYDFVTHTMGVPPIRVKLLMGPYASERDIKKVLTRWAPTQMVPGRTTVFVFFAGHGLRTPAGDSTFLLPYDGDPELLVETAVSRSYLLDSLLDSGAGRVVAFLDTCYSGITRGDEALTGNLRSIRIVSDRMVAGVPTGVTILSAAALDQVSGSLPAARHGLFSYFLMRGLEGHADQSPFGDGDGVINSGEIHTYLRSTVEVQAAGAGRAQTPQLIGDGTIALVSTSPQVSRNQR